MKVATYGIALLLFGIDAGNVDFLEMIARKAERDQYLLL